MSILQARKLIHKAIKKLIQSFTTSKYAGGFNHYALLL